MKSPFVVALTGASGAVYGARLLEVLLAAGERLHLVVSPAANEVMRAELGVVAREPSQLEELFAAAREAMGDPRDSPLVDIPTLSSLVTWHAHGDYAASIASGSYLTRGMVICPCSMDTLASVAHGLGTNLVHRAAAVHLKERRPLVLVPRETPLGSIQLANMTRLAEAGAIILPAMPGFYHRPESIGELIDFVVARICDQLGVRHELSRRWGDGQSSAG